MVTGTLSSTIVPILLWTYAGTTLFSGLVTHLRYRSAKSTLLRDGCKETNSENRTFSEKFSDFIRDNWFIPVPILNFVNTIKLLKKDRFEYARGTRKKELINRGVLKDKEKPKEAPQEQKQKQQNETRSERRTGYQIPARLQNRVMGFNQDVQEQQAQQEQPARSRNEVVGLSVEEEIAIYRRRYNALVAQYRALPSNTPVERMDAMYADIVELRELYNRAVARRDRANQLTELRAQRAAILSSYNFSEEPSLDSENGPRLTL